MIADLLIQYDSRLRVRTTAKHKQMMLAGNRNRRKSPPHLVQQPVFESRHSVRGITDK
jgi:hypothetical protein